METQDDNKYQRRSRNQSIGLIILAVLLILALLATLLFMTRTSRRFKEEQQQMQEERTGLLEEHQRQSHELTRSDSVIRQLRVNIDTLTAQNEEHLRTIANQAAGLRRRSSDNQDLVRQLEAYRLMEADYKKAQAQFAQLLGEYENLELHFDKLESRYKALRDSVEQSKGLRALNINVLNKWERWLWADRYNVLVARRIDETRINFEIWGSPFTPTGSHTVYVSMIAPSGSVLYPAPVDSDVYIDGESLLFTKKQEVNFTGDPFPVAFTINHPVRLDPGTYTIRVYIGDKHVGNKQIVFE